MITIQEMSMLTTLYSQSHRYYHNINHVMDCLTELENFPGSCLQGFSYGDRQVVEKAIWYHDAVYNPYSKENEVNSVKLLDGGYYNSNEKDRVINAILATAKHLETQTHNSTGYDKTPLYITTQVMLDIDLSGFGKSWDICEKHSENIRQEYYHTEDKEFYVGRLNFLNAINKRESLYYTDYFRNKYHEQSKRNIAVEINVVEMKLKRLED